MEEHNGNSNDEVSVNVNDISGPDANVAPLCSNATQAATTSKELSLKTKPSWKADKRNDLVVGNIKGCRKKITQMDNAILKVLSVPRTMTSSNIQDDNL